MHAGDTSTWNPAFRLSLAHEFEDSSVDNRAFRGDYHLIAIYDRALSEAEIANNFGEGPGEIDLLVGDFDFNGSVDLGDFDILNDNFFRTDAAYEDGDANFDGKVHLQDFVIFREAFRDANPAAVPEPAGWTLAAVAIVCLFMALSKQAHVNMSINNWHAASNVK